MLEAADQMSSLINKLAVASEELSELTGRAHSLSSHLTVVEDTLDEAEQRVQHKVGNWLVE